MSSTAAVLDALKRAKGRESPRATLASVNQVSKSAKIDDLILSVLDEFDKGMSVRQFDELLKRLGEGRKRAQSRAEQAAMRKAMTGLPYQRQAIRIYNSQILSTIFAVFIMANFVINILEKEIDPTGETYAEYWTAFDNFFTIVFLVELVMNMYTCGGPHRRLFWYSAWNMFDTVVVAVGIVLMSAPT